ncbi:MAG: WD40 repeat domain-containing protein, partial [Candidatus Promineifilaceae bacterium]
MNEIRLVIALLMTSLFVAGCTVGGAPTEPPAADTELAPTNTAEPVVEPTTTESPSPTPMPTSTPTPAAPAIELAETYQAEYGGGSFNYPEGWEVIEGPGVSLVKSGVEPPYDEADVNAIIQWHWLPDNMVDVAALDDPLEVLDEWERLGEAFSEVDLNFADASQRSIGSLPATTVLGRNESDRRRVYLTLILAKDLGSIALFYGKAVEDSWEQALPVFDAVAGSITIAEPGYPLLIEDYALDLTAEELSPEPFTDELFGFEIAYPEEWLVDERIDMLGKNVIFTMDSGLGQCDWATTGILSDSCQTPTNIGISVVSNDILLTYFGWSDWSEVKTGGVLTLMNIFVGNYFLDYVELSGFETFDLHGRPAFGAAYSGIDDMFTEGNPISGYLAVTYDDERTIFITTITPRAVWRDFWPVFRATMDSFVLRELPGGKFPDMEALYTPPREVNTVAYSPDGRLLASLEEVADLYVWDADTGELVFSALGFSSQNLNSGQVKFSPDGRFLAVQAGAVVVFDAATFELVQVLHEGMLDVYSQAGDSGYEFDFSPDGERIAVASEEGQAFVWDVETGEMKMDLSVDTFSNVSHVAFSPDGELIATIAVEGPVRLWSAVSGEELNVIEDERLRGPLVFSPDSQSLAISHDSSGVVSIWELENRTITKEIEVSTSDNSTWVRSLMYDETGDILFAG